MDDQKKKFDENPRRKQHNKRDEIREGGKGRRKKSEIESEETEIDRRGQQKWNGVEYKRTAKGDETEDLENKNIIKKEHNYKIGWEE